VIGVFGMFVRKRGTWREEIVINLESGALLKV